MSRIVTDPAAEAGRREERKAQNRAKLIDAARKVFAEKGLGEATVRDIVRETDLASGTFYNYFRDKDEVFRALLEEFEAKVQDATRHLRRDTSLSLEERIELGARAFFRVVVEDAELFAVLRRNAGAISMLPTDAVFDAGVEEFAEDLEGWRREGDLPADVDLGYLSGAIAGMAFQVAIRLVDHHPADPDEAARFLTLMVLGAVRTLGEAGALPELA
ncbi:MAG TPA: TetR/AcrR family transcriptional regulator [Thermoleophilaceae bacterium]